MLPKATYMALSAADKRKVKAGMRKPRAKIVRARAPKTNYGSKVGRYLGSYLPYAPGVGAEVGSCLGTAAGNAISSVFGQGDYALANFRVTNNTLLTAGNTPPQFGTGERTTRVKHREYIGDVFSTTNFNQQIFYINPGLASTFPWLASVAGNYECYRLFGMLFEYKSMSTNSLSGNNTSLGTVMMATQYNAASPNFLSKQQLENYEYSQSCKPAESMLHYIECDPKHTPHTEMYVRTGTVPSAQDARLYDWGQFSIATQGMPTSGQNQGELWCTYDIELFKPKLVQGQYGNTLNAYHARLNGGSTTNYFPINSIPYSNLQMIVSTNTITFPQAIVAGVYRLTYTQFGASGASNGPNIAATSNCSASPTVFNTIGSNTNQLAFNSSNYFVAVVYVTITGPSAVLTVTGGTFPVGSQVGELLIEQTSGLLV